LGATGFVNAAFELKEQITRGEIPEPDYIYVAAGTMGTSAGLILGLKAAGMASRVIPVQVADDKFTNEKNLLKLIRTTNSLLYSLDSSFPACEFSEQDTNIKHGFLGEKYALFTREGVDAVNRMKNQEGIKLEGTYTGKTLAALIADVEKQNLNDKVILFWNTYNSRDFSDAMSTIDYHQLPRPFYQYFEEDIQSLDRY
jgi:D-cysteine desulfhydrase